MKITDGTTVSIEYTLQLEDETVADSNVGKEPLKYQHGAGQIIKGLEKRLEGMSEGETSEISVPPEEAYGEVQTEAIREVPKDQIPVENLQVGMQLEAQDKNGQRIPLKVAEIKDDSVMLDFNHPLAGETLHFSVKILNVESAVQ